jgi:hypothetical protein
MKVKRFCELGGRQKIHTQNEAENCIQRLLLTRLISFIVALPRGFMGWMKSRVESSSKEGTKANCSLPFGMRFYCLMSCSGKSLFACHKHLSEALTSTSILDPSNPKLISIIIAAHTFIKVKVTSLRSKHFCLF